MRFRFILFLAVFPFCVFAQSTVRVDSFYAPNLRAIKHYTVLLPGDTDRMRRYLILYLLHGYSGGHRDWITRTDLSDYVKSLPLIVILPDAGNSWYVNSSTHAEQKYEDFLINDLRVHVEQHFPVDTSRRAIAGLSMGGYGALMLALRYPSMFRFAGSLSGALSVPHSIEDWEHESWEKTIVPNLKEVFGPSPNRFRDEHDPFILYRNTPDSLLPYLYFAIGTDDGFVTFLPAHRMLTDSLRMYGAAYEYHETPGGHDWKYWGRELHPLLKRMMELLNGRK